MEPEIFDRIHQDNFMGTTDKVFPQMIDEKLPVFSYIHEGYWADIGNRSDYLQTHKDCLNGKALSINLDSPDCPAGPNIIQRVLIGQDCHISEHARVGPNAVLGNGCRVEGNAIVESSVCWDRVVIKEGAAVRESIAGDDCVINAGQTLLRDMAVAEK